MRRLILILILSIIPMGIHAGTKGPRLVVVPFTPSVSESISMDDGKECQLQATLAATTFQNAQQKLRPLYQQLEIWDSFAASDHKDNYKAGHLAKLRKLVIMSYNSAITYPKLTPQDYGEMIYSACAGERPLSKVKV